MFERIQILKSKIEKFYVQAYIQQIRSFNNVSIDEPIHIIGKPLIQVVSNAELIIKENVTLRSINTSYHLNMHSPVKLQADMKGAKILIGKNSRINGACVHAWNKIVIGSNCLIAANSQIFDSNGHKLSFENIETRINTQDTGIPVILEDNVWIGSNCIVLPGVTIGYGSVLAAGSVLNKSIPPMCLYGGNPAKLIKCFKSLNDKTTTLKL